MTTISWSQVSEAEHIVQFCETDAFLLDSVGQFISTGLRQGDVCIVLATEPHRTSLEQRLHRDGFDVGLVPMSGQYIACDAAATLAQIMVEGALSQERFVEVIGGMIQRAGQYGERIRIFGELVVLLWEDGYRAEAIRLEELWNALAKTHSFSLFCTYPMYDFDGEAYENEFMEICQQHSHVIPAESYSLLTDSNERLRAITLLQQKANSLEAEVAERKAAEKALRLSEKRYRQLFESAPDGILILDPTTQQILDANPFMEALLGYSREEITGKDLFEIGLLKDMQVSDALFQSVQTQPCVRFEASLATKTTIPVEIEVNATLYDEGEQNIIQCNIRDITARKEIERRKDDFISMASHELKTPVTSLKGFTQVLQRRLKKQADEESLRFLGIMDTQLNRLTRLINDLLDVSKMQHGQLNYREECFALDILTEEVVRNLQAATTTHQLLIQSSTPVQVYGDRDRIGQVLLNFLTNAIKYSPQADSVIVHLSKDQHNATVQVQDFGIGIDEAYHQHIFERFYQVTEPQEKTFPGLGMGLYISAEIVKRHGGTISLSSQPGLGSTFSFTLPLPD